MQWCHPRHRQVHIAGKYCTTGALGNAAGRGKYMNGQGDPTIAVGGGWRFLIHDPVDRISVRGMAIGVL